MEFSESLGSYVDLSLKIALNVSCLAVPAVVAIFQEQFLLFIHIVPN